MYIVIYFIVSILYILYIYCILRCYIVLFFCAVFFVILRSMAALKRTMTKVHKKKFADSWCRWVGGYILECTIVYVC